MCNVETPLVAFHCVLSLTLDRNFAPRDPAFLLKFANIRFFCVASVSFGEGVVMGWRFAYVMGFLQTVLDLVVSSFSISSSMAPASATVFAVYSK